MLVQRIFVLCFQALLWAVIICFSLLLTHNAVLYFTHGGEYGILPEKILARRDLLWNICFYVHLPVGIICLLTPIILFARRFIKSRRVHSRLGKLYIGITLLLVCPTGMYLALYAKGGLITQIGFMLQGVLLFWYTYQGYRAIQKGRQTDHIQYMTRSYAMVLVVLTFRVLHIVFFLWNVPYQDNYAMSQWLGMSMNMFLAELAIVFMNLKIKTQQLNPKIT